MCAHITVQSGLSSLSFILCDMWQDSHWSSRGCCGNIDQSIDRHTVPPTLIRMENLVGAQHDVFRFCFGGEVSRARYLLNCVCVTIHTVADLACGLLNMPFPSPTLLMVYGVRCKICVSV